MPGAAGDSGLPGKAGHPIVIGGGLMGEIGGLGVGETLRTVVHRHLGECGLWRWRMRGWWRI